MTEETRRAHTFEDLRRVNTFSRAVPILDDDGKIKEWFGAASDVTDRKEKVGGRWR